MECTYIINEKSRQNIVLREEIQVSGVYLYICSQCCFHWRNLQDWCDQCASMLFFFIGSDYWEEQLCPPGQHWLTKMSYFVPRDCRSAFCQQQSILFNIGLLLDRVARWFCEIIDQNIAQSIICRNYYITFTVEKSWLFLYFSKKMPKVRNRPMVENIGRKFAHSGNSDAG
jgi:hypothetical protein